jgi:ATPase family associated with various cellular activities (AAA)
MPPDPRPLGVDPPASTAPGPLARPAPAGREAVAAPLDAVGHLLAELRRLELILLHRFGQGEGRPRDREVDRESGALPGAPPSGTPPALALEAHAAALRDALRASLDAGVKLPLVELCRALRLDDVSIGVLMLALAPHVDRHFERVYAWLQGGPAGGAPRLDLALQVFAATPAERIALRDCFQPNAPLLRSGFFRLVDPPEGPPASALSQLLWASPRLLRFLTDRPGAEPEVEAVRALSPLPPPTRSVLAALGRFAPWGRPDAEPAAIGTLSSEDSGAALAGAAALAEHLEMPSLLVDLARAGAGKHPVERSIEAAFDEARLLGALLAIAGFDELDDRARELALGATVSALDRFEGPCLLVTRAAPDLRHELRRRPVLSLDAPLPDTDERRELWAAELEGRPDLGPHLPEIAARYRLGSGQIRDAAKMVATLDAAEGASTAHLRTACQAQSRHGLGQLAQRVPPWGSWGDLVLPAESTQKLRSIAEHITHRETVFREWGLGAKVSAWRGVSALFAGPPGTGKTLSASLVAQALGLELFRIDLAGVVSKYIGETEKNLDRVFRAAHRSNAVLFFDEADALFGKRTEVKDAHDRHANVETSYLLQRLESFEGLSILATNLKKNIDAAFLRRIDVLVEFPFPGPIERLKLWQTLLPRSMPRAPDVDLGLLAERFELAGGHIKNAVQVAALQAASEGRAVGMAHLLTGVRWELQKQGKTVGQLELAKERGEAGAAVEGGAGERVPRRSRAGRG